MLNRERLTARLKVDEGFRNKMYRDVTGHLTIGWGHNMMKPISDAAAEQVLEDDIDDAIRNMPHKDIYDKLSGPRKEVLVNMCFNLGPRGLKSFKRMWVALSVEHYVLAASEMLSSRWAEQVGDRAKRLAKAMETGVPKTLETRSDPDETS
jgi:lysozyme